MSWKLKERKSLARGDNYITGCRLKLSGKNLKKCRFTGTVRTDHSVAVPLCELDVNILEQRLFPDAKGYVICTNHLKEKEEIYAKEDFTDEDGIKASE